MKKRVIKLYVGKDELFSHYNIKYSNKRYKRNCFIITVKWKSQMKRNAENQLRHE